MSPADYRRVSDILLSGLPYLDLLNDRLLKKKRYDRLPDGFMTLSVIKQQVSSRLKFEWLS